MAEINGIAHIQLSVSDPEKSIPFYKTLLGGMGMTLVKDSPDGIYALGGRTGIAISASVEPYTGEGFNQRRPGLHHFCFRARSREDVDAIHELAIQAGARIVHPPREDGFAPGYYSVLFEDPDGIRLEANHVPGKGLLQPGRGQVGGADTKWDD